MGKWYLMLQNVEILEMYSKKIKKIVKKVVHFEKLKSVYKQWLKTMFKNNFVY